MHITEAEVREGEKEERRGTITQRSVWKGGARTVTRSAGAIPCALCIVRSAGAHRKWVRG